MQPIEFNTEVKLGDKVVDAISVAHLTFSQFAAVWKRAASAKGKPEAALQRERILHQTHFMSGGERVVPDLSQLSTLPATVAKAIINNLDADEGPAGKVISEGDGIATPIVVKLGSPIKVKDGKGVESELAELEFMASTYGELEDVLSSVDEIGKAMALLTNIASPVGSNLPRLPGFALDRITLADGLMIMRKVCPSF